MYFDGLLSHLIDLAAKGETDIADMSSVLERIEDILPSLSANAPGRRELVGIYALWHRHVAVDLRRPSADELLAKYDGDLTLPSSAAFAVGLLTDAAPSWTAQEYLDLAKTRRKERGGKRPSPLPQGIDAALLLIAAEKCAEAGMAKEAATLAAWTIEELPGNATLQAWEASLSAGGFSEVVDLRSLVFSGLDATDADADLADNETETKTEVEVDAANEVAVAKTDGLQPSDGTSACEEEPEVRGATAAASDADESSDHGK
jgi:hypothetical protein